MRGTRARLIEFSSNCSIELRYRIPDRFLLRNWKLRLKSIRRTLLRERRMRRRTVSYRSLSLGGNFASLASFSLTKSVFSGRCQGPRAVTWRAVQQRRVKGEPGPGPGTAAIATILQMAVGQNRYRDAKNRESCRGRGAFLPVSPSQSSVCRFEIDACKPAAN